MSHYDGTMTKTTLRIPDYLFDELRERSRQQRTSLNATAIDALRRGLGKGTSNPAMSDLLGPLIVQPATMTFDPDELERRLSGLTEEQRDLSTALDWTREDR